MKAKKVWVDLYRFEFYMCRDNAELDAVVMKDYPDAQSENDDALGRFRIWCKGKGHKNKVGIYAGSLDTLAHECLHASLRIMEEIGMTVDCEHDEPAAHLAGYLFRTYCKNLHPGMEMKF